MLPFTDYPMEEDVFLANKTRILATVSDISLKVKGTIDNQVQNIPDFWGLIVETVNPMEFELA